MGFDVVTTNTSPLDPVMLLANLDISGAKVFYGEH